jgi:YD repeat-containing protein
VTQGSTTLADYQYDPAGRLQQVARANGATTTYRYDALNRLTQRGTTSCTYNGDGVLMAQTANGATINYTRDLAAPLSQVLQTTQAGATTNYLYGFEPYGRWRN